MKFTEVPYKYYTDSNEAEESLEPLFDEKHVGVDSETTALDPWRGKLRLIQIATEQEAHVYDYWKMSDRVKFLLSELFSAQYPIKVIHHAKFDVRFFRYELGVKKFGTIFDTMLGAMVASQAHYNSDIIFSARFDLASVAREYSEIEMHLKKELQASDWNKVHLTGDQIRYSAFDAFILLPIRKAIVERLKQYHLIDAAKLDFDAVEPVAAMELNGFNMNRKRWLAKHEQTKLECEGVAQKLYSILAPGGIPQRQLFEGAPEHPPINLNSRPQLIAAMQGLGIKLPTLEDGKITTRTYKLQSIARQHTVIPTIIDYRGLQKAKSSYGANWFRYIDEITGRIHADFRLIGADTARMSCTDPNLQQIPKEDDYRKCFEAGPGKTLVWGDYSLMELRIVAALAGEEEMIRAFESGKDYHKMTAATIFGVPFEEVTKEQRDPSKNMNYLVVYGGGPNKLAETMSCTLDRAQQVIDSYLKKLPKLATWLDSAAASAIHNRVAKTLCGRMFRFQFNHKDRKQAAAVGRKGKNSPIQGTSCDILKRALRLLHDEIGDSLTMMLVMIAHDELVLEVDVAQATRAKRILKKVMEQAWTEAITTVPIKIDLHSGRRWHK